MANRVLMIDDDRELLTLLMTKLGPAGFQIRGALDGMYAMKEAQTFKPDVIVLDLLFPGGGGFQILQRLKSNLHTKNVPVIVLTVVEDETKKEEAFRAGAKVYLSKKAGADQLITEINHLVNPSLAIKPKGEWSGKVDHRRYVRFDVEFPLTFLQTDAAHSTEDGKRAGTVYNIGIGGCKIRSKHPVPVGILLTLQLSLWNEIVPVTIDAATVLWSIEQEFGVEFVKISETEKGRFNQYIRSLSRSQNKPAL